MKTAEQTIVETVSKFEFLEDFQFFLTSDSDETAHGIDSVYCLLDRDGNHVCGPMRLRDYSGGVLPPLCQLLTMARMPVVMVTSIAQVLFGGTTKDKETLFVTVQRVNRGERTRSQMGKVFSLINSQGRALSRVRVDPPQKSKSQGIECSLLRMAGIAENNAANPLHWVFYPENHEVRDPALTPSP